MAAVMSDEQVGRLAGQLEVQYCSNVRMLRRDGVTLTQFVETGLRDAAVLDGIGLGAIPAESMLVTHFPVLAGRLAKMQREIGEVGV